MRAKFVILLLFIAFGCQKEIENPDQDSGVLYQLLTKKKKFVAGDSIVLSFRQKGTPTAAPVLVINNKVGLTVLEPQVDDTILNFQLPEAFSTKSGGITWKLMAEKITKNEGDIRIIPDTTTNLKMYSYLGPNSLVVGTDDFAYFVSAPVDQYDNPLPEGTAIEQFFQYKNDLSSETLRIEDLIVWKRFDAGQEVGQRLMTTKVNAAVSKERPLYYRSGRAAPFQIQAEQKHNFADGNQQLMITTGIIKDIFGNVVNDGTLVSFNAYDQHGHLTQMQATTINGRATGQWVHPYRELVWDVQAAIAREAKSNTIALSFLKAVDDFLVYFDVEARQITVGPVMGFMEQTVPEGLPVLLTISQDNTNFSEKMMKTTKDGLAIFPLSADGFKSGAYEATIEAAGLKKTIKIQLP
ncbi:MAG: hypothetical protein WBG71_15665 [Leeuwenhoekiella sp.]